MNRIIKSSSDTAKPARQIYQNVILLAVFLHLVYVFVFRSVPVSCLFLYNIGSVLFYIFMLYIVHLKKYRITVAAIHLEVSLFVTVCTIVTGWNTGFYHYLLALASLVYFCPFNKKYTTYFISLAELLLLIALKIITETHPSDFVVLSGSFRSFIYLGNMIAGFSIILLCAYLSDLSATVTRKELETENETLSMQAHYDHLTGLASRSYFLDCFQNKQFCFYSVCMGDIDNFKQVNDQYGHNFGDYVLQTVSSFMKKMSSEQISICRWGGEEFVILFYDTTPEQAAGKVEALRNTINKYDFHQLGIHIHITMTFGISSGDMESSLKEVINSADQLLYLGKKQGKDRIIF